MSDEHAEAAEPEEAVEAEHTSPVEEISDEALDEVAGGSANAAMYVKPPTPGT